MGFFDRLFGRFNLGDLLVTYLISRQTLEEMKMAKVGDEVAIPTTRTKLPGIKGYWEIPLGPARKIED